MALPYSRLKTKEINHLHKVRLTILWLNTWPAIGGAERAQISIFREVAKKHRFLAGLQQNPTEELSSEIESFSSKQFRLPLIRLNQSINPFRLAKIVYHLFAVATTLRTILRDEHVDIVHVSNINDVPFAALATLGTNTKLVWMVENPERFNSVNVAILNLSKIDGLIGTSNAILSQAINSGVKSTVSRTIQNPYDDTHFFQEELSQKEVSSNTVRIGFAGVLCDRKGVLELCEAYLALTIRLHSEGECNLRTELLLAGNGEPDYISRIHDVSKRLPASHQIKLLDHIKDPIAMRAFYSSLDLFVMLSKKEGLSLAMLEAMATGAPSLILTPWGVDVIQSEVSGINLTSDKPEVVALELMKLIKAPALRKKIGNEGARFVRQNNTPSVIAEEVVTFYNRVLYPTKATVSA